MSVGVNYYYFVLGLFPLIKRTVQKQIIITHTDWYIKYYLEGTEPKQNNNNPHRLTYYKLIREKSTKTK
jgi:hypothetical protein